MTDYSESYFLNPTEPEDMNYYNDSYYISPTAPEDMTYYNDNSYLIPTAPVDECTKSEEKAFIFFESINDEVINVINSC